MKRFFSVCLVVVLSILFAPISSDNYSAIAGRVSPYNIASEYCECGLPAPPACYEEVAPDNWQLCNIDGGLMEEASTAPLLSDTPSDDLGVTAFATAYMLWQFIF